MMQINSSVSDRKQALLKMFFYQQSNHLSLQSIIVSLVLQYIF